MNIEIIGFVLTTMGEILLGAMVLIIHLHILKEHRIDADVLRQMKQEQFLGILAIVSIMIGFVLQASSKI